MTRGLPHPRRPLPVGSRGLTVLGIAAAATAAVLLLGLDPAGLVPREAGRELLGDVVRAALRPALDYEAPPPPGAPALLVRTMGALTTTVLYAVAAMSVAVPAGLLLGALGSDVLRGPRIVRALARTLAALARSVHELVWAILLLAALGLAPASGVFAIAIPYAGTIAKVTGELFDEAERDAWRALGALGAPRASALVIGIAPRAFADVASYLFYRFECAVRSAAVLGFFGAPTIGSSIAQSFENLQLREMWTYLYALMLTVLAMEWLGARLRRSLA